MVMANTPERLGPVSVVVQDVSVMIDQAVLLAPTSFTVGSGHVLALTGPNGSGKTTLLHAIAGRTRPSTGSVTVAGAIPDYQNPAFRARLAALLGLPPLARNLTVREHVVMVAASWGHTLTESEQSAAQLLSECGMTTLASRFPHELSSGQTQLFSLALTLARPFQVLLLDEPEQRLDPDRVDMVGKILRARVELGATIIMASHSSLFVEQLADKVVTLTEGIG